MYYVTLEEIERAKRITTTPWNEKKYKDDDIVDDEYVSLKSILEHQGIQNALCVLCNIESSTAQHYYAAYTGAARRDFYFNCVNRINQVLLQEDATDRLLREYRLYEQHGERIGMEALLTACDKARKHTAAGDALVHYIRFIIYENYTQNIQNALLDFVESVAYTLSVTYDDNGNKCASQLGAATHKVICNAAWYIIEVEFLNTFCKED